MDKTYDVFAFRQQSESPIQLAFVASAGDIAQWSGIPRKSDEFLTGYQRFKDTDRVNKYIVPFFQNPKNCSPTAVILALRSDAGIGRCMLEPADIPAGSIVPARLTIHIDDARMESDEIFTQALDYITSRLDKDKDLAADPVEVEDDQDLDDAEDVDAESENQEATVHLGTETLARLKEYLEDKGNWHNAAFRAAIRDFVKPAMLIDGQHRIGAAAKFGPNGLPFMVCGLYGAGWEEQVFQFTVVNLKPKKIQPSLITSIAALSLSKSEQGALRSRLNQAGVKMTEVEIMSLVAYDETSPFYGLIDMGVGRSAKADLLGYAGVKRIAKEWFTCKRPSLLNISKSLFQTENNTKAAQEWRSSKVWFEWFEFFWSAIRDHYPDSLWKKSAENNLFVGASLWALQEALLIECDGAMKSQWKVDPLATFEERLTALKNAFSEVVTTYLGYLPSEMWTIPWAKSSIDTNQGRDEFRNVVTLLITEGKKEERVWRGWKKHDWFNKT